MVAVDLAETRASLLISSDDGCRRGCSVLEERGARSQLGVALIQWVRDYGVQNTLAHDNVCIKVACGRGHTAVPNVY